MSRPFQLLFGENYVAWFGFVFVKGLIYFIQCCSVKGSFRMQVWQVTALGIAFMSASGSGSHLSDVDIANGQARTFPESKVNVLYLI